MIEALVVGVVASALGLLAGIGLFLLLGKAVPVVNQITGTGSIPLVVSPARVVQVILVGTIVTVVSAAIPAFRASRTRPMAAMRTAAVDRSGTNRYRAIAGVVLIALGAVLLLAGMAAKNPWLVAGGPILLFFGTLIGGPVLAYVFATGVGYPLRRLGTAAGLGAANAKRNPNRTATTANALVIGMFLVVFVTAAGGALRDWAVTEASQFSTADLTVTSSGSGIPTNLARRIHTTNGVKGTADLYDRIGQLTDGSTGATRGGGFGDRVSAANFSDVAHVLDVKSRQGDLATLRDDQVAVTEPSRQPTLRRPSESERRSGSRSRTA